jgi:SNF2 family DNA or RNA helicase
MHRIKNIIDQLKASQGDKVTQDKLNEYGLRGITLRPYQLDGVTFIRECFDEGHGCLLGDEMGLGKTIQVDKTS